MPAGATVMHACGRHSDAMRKAIEIRTGQDTLELKLRKETSCPKLSGRCVKRLAFKLKFRSALSSPKPSPGDASTEDG